MRGSCNNNNFINVVTLFISNRFPINSSCVGNYLAHVYFPCLARLAPLGLTDFTDISTFTVPDLFLPETQIVDGMKYSIYDAFLLHWLVFASNMLSHIKLIQSFLLHRTNGTNLLNIPYISQKSKEFCIVIPSLTIEFFISYIWRFSRIFLLLWSEQ